MPRPKRGPALIELIHARGATSVPAWLRSGESDNPETGKDPTDTAGVRPPAPSFATPTGSGTVPTAAIHGERIVFSLSSASAGVVAFVLIVLIGAGFVVGHRIGKGQGQTEGYNSAAKSFRAGATGEIEAARRTAPNSEIFEGLGSSPVTPKPAPTQVPGEPKAVAGDKQAPRSPWVKGHTYIVVQEFKTQDRSQAAEAQLFLRDNGVDTAILESKGTYRYRLVAAKGFNRDDPAQRRWCDQYHAKIKELGNQFVTAGGRYDLQGYQKKLTGDRW